MKKLFFILPIAAILVTGCQKTEPAEPTEPVSLMLEYDGITLGERSIDAYADKLVSYSKITPEGYDETVHILQGNGGYEVTKIQDTADSQPKSWITTEARIVNDNSVVVTIKSKEVLPECVMIEYYERFVCADTYLVTDSEGKQANIIIGWDGIVWFGGVAI